uniref:Protein tyrosine kinase 7 (inactive) n=1 Tax=Cyprinus carpio TaxID=7962 RepID=A0A8C1L909_CYPCA
DFLRPLADICPASSLQFSEEPQSQDALHGRSAILRCELSGPEDMRFWWTQDGRRVNDSDRRFQEGSNLKFTAVDRHADTGSFQCVASSNTTGETLSSASASFNIKWLERGAVTMNEPASEAELEEAERIVLQCHIDGHPRPSSKWFKDGVQLDRKDRILMLTNLSTGDSGIYSCCAQNAAGKVCSNHNITLNIIDKSVPRVLVAPVDQVVLGNEEAVFHCQFRAKPPPLVEWFHDAEPVVNKSRVVVYANGTLHISQVKQRSTGVYKCVAQYGEKQVHVEAALRIAEIADMGERMFQVFTAGRSERVRCDPPRGQPEPDVWWEHAGARVASEGRVHQRDGDLIFSPTDGSDSGVYTCVARNKAGQKQQELVVTVATSPEWIVQPQDTHVEEGQPGFLHCHARGTPEPRVTWYRKSVPISEEGSRYKLFSNGTLRINSAEVKDAQTYSCVCVTEAGSLTGHAQVLILEKLKFKPVPQSSQCLQLDRESSVSCVATGREKPIIHWSRADGADLPSHMSQMNGVLHFSTVTRADAGNYTCVASSSTQGEIRAYVHLTVGVHVEFKLEPEQTTVYQGHTAVFHCQASGDPQPYVQWMLRDKLLSSSSSSRPVISLHLNVALHQCLSNGCSAVNGCRQNESPNRSVCLILTAPIHCRASIAETLMQCCISTNLMKTQTRVCVCVCAGRGVFGEVFLAKARAIEEAEPETLVLVKSLESREETHRAEFRRELEMFSKLNHAHVVRLLGVCRETQPHYMILEYVDLGDLKQFLRISKSSDEKLKPHPISTRTKVSICAQVARGMQHLSDRGFVHKDLAARNCLISGQRHVKVSALSLSKDVYNSEYYQHRQLWIPLRWLSSESVFEGEFCSKADVWAFGVLMWEVFSLGELPYPALNDQQVLEGLQAGTLRLSPPVNCPAHVCSLMSRCWASSPKERPTFSEILQTLTDSSADTKV